MKKVIFLPVICAVWTCLHAAIIVSDTFSVADRNLSSHTPLIGPGNWGGSSDWKITGNTVRANTGLSGGSSGHFQVIDLGSGYFVSNPNIYELSATLQYDTSSMSDTSSWISIGFTAGTNGSYRANRTHYSTNTSTLYGAPSITLRANGEALVKTEQASLLHQSGTGIYAEDTAHTVKLVLDTTQTNWTVDAYVNGGQLDLDSVTPSLSYVFSSNPTLRYLSLSSRQGVSDSQYYFLDNVLLQTIPETSTLSLMGLTLAGLILLCKRRNR